MFTVKAVSLLCVFSGGSNSKKETPDEMGLFKSKHAVSEDEKAAKNDKKAEKGNVEFKSMKKLEEEDQKTAANGDGAAPVSDKEKVSLEK